MAKNGFGRAVEVLIAGHRQLVREHPKLDDLEAYHRGTLPPERREALAEHLASCQNCCILLLYGVIAPAESEHLDEVLEREVTAAWERLRPNLKDISRKGRRLAQERIPLEEALALSLEISRALKALHCAGRTLHSMRAEDVMITPSGQVQILDLGIALTPESLEVGYGRPADDAVIDLYRSLSPEQVAGEGLTQRSNLFSLGVLLYELLTGASPFRDSTPLGTISRILSLEPPPVSELNPAIEPVLSRLIDRLLAKEPEDRPPSAAVVARELEAIVGRVGGPGRQQMEQPDVEEQIEQLYDEIIALAREQPAGNEVHRDETLERSYAKLLELQRAEAERFRERFEDSLAMPIDAGEKLLDRLRALREELEDPASSDPAAQNADDPPTSAKAR